MSDLSSITLVRGCHPGFPPGALFSETVSDKQAGKRDLLSHYENTPEIKFECQENKEVCKTLKHIFEIFKAPDNFPENLRSHQVILSYSKY